MAATVTEEAGGKILEVNLSGTLTKEDYEHFLPVVEKAIKQHGKVRLLVRMKDFHGWNLAALWQDIKFDFKHHGDIERLAMVGDRKWEAGMAGFCKPFTSAAIRYFDESQAAEAAAWLRS